MIVCLILVIIAASIFLSDIIKINMHFCHPRSILPVMTDKTKKQIKTGRKPIHGKAMPKFYIRLPEKIIDRLKKCGAERVREYLMKF